MFKESRDTLFFMELNYCAKKKKFYKTLDRTVWGRLSENENVIIGSMRVDEYKILEKFT